MGDIVNLKRVRKKRGRAAKNEQAAANRAKFGCRKDERQAAEAERRLAAKRLDHLKRDE
ncbi:MAG: DUF4169 family protein [Rhizobiales bacterium]|nr:DUF4169 family protein [Hyphomicrobiales bacterium]MBI3672673.1 DUF4169 family protein [Hyphomicrobiales bacterium]